MGGGGVEPAAVNTGRLIGRYGKEKEVSKRGGDVSPERVKATPREG